MNNKLKFDISKLKGKLSLIRDWMTSHHMPPRVMFILMGIISTIWFLIRVIPKPSRAGYACMQVAAPVMSGFVVYLLSLGGITLALRKAKKNLLMARYVAAGSFIIVALFAVVVSLTNGMQFSFAGIQTQAQTKQGPDDTANQPFGKPMGVNPGRVVWIWNADATNENCTTGWETQDWYWKPQNINEKVVGTMFRDALNKLTGKSTVAESWNVLFHSFNAKKLNSDKGYTKGEKIFIKINQGTSRWLLTQEDKDKGYYYPTTLKDDEARRKTSMGPTETNPYTILEILRELVNEMGINQADIAVGDPMTHIYGHNYDIWVKEFPKVVYFDKFSNMHGRTMIYNTEKELLFYSDKTQKDKLYDVVEKANYLINVANLKPHMSAGISLTAKNHFGTQGSPTAQHLHYALMRTRGNTPNNLGYGKYRVLVDLMGSKYLGQNTLLYMVDGLFGGGTSETKGPVKYFMAPFNDDWSNSIFLSQDQVALESVCFDFLRTEWNGVNKHNATNNAEESNPNWNGVDDYLHQAADQKNWPAGIVYDPDNSGKPIPSLGVHEHWNNAEDKQYSRNLGTGEGIELLSIPESLVKKKSKVSSSNPASTSNPVSTSNPASTSMGSSSKTSSNSNPVSSTNTVSSSNTAQIPFGDGFMAKSFFSVVVDDNDIKWFLTESGLASFDGKNWTLHNKNSKIPTKDLKDFTIDAADGNKVWLATPQGAVVTSLPLSAESSPSAFSPANSPISSENVMSVAIGKSPLRWIGTDKGVFAYYDNKWLKNTYERKYPADLFKDFPITSMAADATGDTVFVGTDGAGVARLFRDKVDGVSGASEYAQWGPIEIPSDKVYSICLTPDGTQWFGTDLGVGKHTGYNTLENWTIYNTDNGLVDNFVQSIACDKKGNLWFGTKGGVSMFDGTTWTSMTEKDGLSSNNVLSIAVDKAGIVWIGTDNGVTSVNNGKLTSYR